ncbi:glucose 1-dehydrogenase [Kineococcus sp. R8]|uniref:glucose 1-dehydrogenase n=1 Tax=Kineococcus siccus TaxID=2696567 RepID=UPI00141332CF|nr:glucose 1-dehydrogenase [Kineococcus siccus]
MNAPAGFEGRIAVVTGAGSGIGEATAKLLAARGAVVVVSDLVPEAAERVHREITAAGGRADVHVGDVTDPAYVDALVEGAVARHGRLDVLHNNVGAGGRGEIVDVDDATWSRGLDLNLGATFRGIRAALRTMRTTGGGAIVNTASLSGTGKVPDVVAYYGTAKAGVIQLTREAAVEAGPFGIRVNAVVPAAVLTPAFAGFLGTEDLQRYTDQVPLRRVATPLDVAELVAFLASDAASVITGVAVGIDGGFGSVVAQPHL